VTTSWSIHNSPPDGSQVLPAGRLFSLGESSELEDFGKLSADITSVKVNHSSTSLYGFAHRD
jgi:hypothetical protein